MALADNVKFKELMSLKAKVEHGLPALRQKLRFICGDRAVTQDDFIKILPSKDPQLPRRFFQVVSKGVPEVDQDKLVCRIVSLVRDEDDAKLKAIFQIYDANGDGTLSFQEIGSLLRGCLEENGLSFSKEEVDQLTLAFIEEADKDNSQTVDFEEFKALLERTSSLIECVCRSFERWMLLSPAKKSKTNSKRPSFWQSEYIRNNISSVVALCIYVIISISLGTGRAAQFILMGANEFVVIARAAGMLLNFNCSLIMVFVLRRTLTQLRIWGLAAILPLDKNIKYHKYCGFIIAACAIAHTLGHLGNYATLHFAGKGAYFSLIFGRHPDLFHFFFGAANITGWICLASLFIIVCTALPIVRKSGHFEIFAYCHLFYIVFWISLLLHGPRFWAWLIVPGILFVIERTYNIFTLMGDSGHAYIVRARVLPSKVSHLAIRRPKNFHYHPGDFVYIQIPYVASWEWHPFTISSAPEMPDVIFLHIRSCGQWTSRLFSVLSEQEKIGMKAMDPKIFQRPYETIIAIPPTPDSLRSSTSLPPSCSEEIVETPFIRRRNNNKSNKVVQRESRVINYRQVVQDLTARLGSIVGTQAVPNLRVIQFARPLVRCCDDDYESQFFSELENSPGNGADAAELMSRDKVVSSTPNNSIKQSRRRSEKAKSKPTSSGATILRASIELPVRIDGPYGSPSSHIFSTEHAVLIGAGIGITPFASILQSIMFRYAKSQQKCPRCAYSWSDPIPGDVMRLKKVDFIWLNRDQKSIEWFVHLLSQLEMTQAEINKDDRFLDIHIFITSALDGADIRALGLQLALGLMHEKKERDMITGLRTRTKPGRPDWNEVFENIRRNKKGKVTVFFCGAPMLGKELHSLCYEFGFNFHKENF